MATYVNDLRLKEIATGDESGTWGTSTNTNLELIAEAFSFGTEAITTNADTHTTTIADGSTDPGRSLFLKYTGTLDSACTITIGPNTVSKLWLIQNSTSGSQNIIIKQGSGATVTVPNGQTKAIYSDGAGSGGAMVDAFAHLNVVDLTVEDDLTITDDLTVNGDLDLEGSIDVNGTANLDVVDIDGALTQDGGAVFNEASADVDFRIESNGQENMFFVDGGDDAVVIGNNSSRKTLFNTTATAAFQIEGTSGNTAAMSIARNSNDDNGPQFVLAKSNGTSAGAVTVVTDDALLGRISFQGADGTQTVEGARVEAFVDGTPGANDMPGRLVFSTTQDGSATPTERWRMDNVGNLTSGGNAANGIGATPSDANFAEIGAGYLNLNRDDTADASQIQFGKNGIAHSHIQTSASGLLVGSLGNMNTFVNAGTSGSNVLDLQTGGTTRMRVSNQEVIVNEDGSSGIDFRVESDNNANMLFVDAGSDHVNIGTATDYDAVLNVLSTGNDKTLSLVSTDTDASAGPILALTRQSSSSAADNDYIGEIKFEGLNDANEQIPYAGIAGRIIDASDGTEDGRFEMYTELAGAQISRVLADATETVINQDSADLDFRVESDGNANMFVVNAGANGVGIGTDNPGTRELKVNNASNQSDITITSGANQSAQLLFGDQDADNQGIIQYNNNGDTMHFFVDGTERFAIADGLTFEGKSGTSPIFEMINQDNEDVNTGRETSIRFSGHRSGGEDVVNAQIGGHHFGSADDDQGMILMYTNKGSATLAERLRLTPGEAAFNEGSENTDFRVESDGNANMLVVDADNNTVCIGGTVAETADHLEVLSSDSNTNLRIRNTNAGAGGPRLVFDKSSSSQANDDVVAEMLFIGKDSAGNAEQFAGLKVESSNVTSGAEDGTTTYAQMVDGSYRNMYTLNHVGACFNEGSVNNLDFRVESGSKAHMLFLDSGLSRIGMGDASSPLAMVHIKTETNTPLMIESTHSDGGYVEYRLGASGAILGYLGAANALMSGGSSSDLGLRAQGSLNFGTNGNNSRMTIGSGGITMELAAGAGNADLRYNTGDEAVTYDTSSERFKENIRDNTTYGLAAVNALQSRMFEYKDGGRTDVGLIAEEVVEVVPELVGLDSEGNPLTVDYKRFVSVLVKAVQEQQTVIEALTTRIAALEGE